MLDTRTALLSGFLLLGVAACQSPETDVSVPALPEAATGYTAKPGWATERFAVAAANPLATEAGYEILKAGGSALDAAVAVQMVLTLVEPQSSGIGGGAFLLHWDGERVVALDGRETAPAAADETLFLQPDGTPMNFQQAVIGGRSVGVPGAVKMLEQAHREHGKLPWKSLFQTAIHLADDGFPVSPRLHGLLQKDPALRDDPQAAAFYYQADGNPWPVGHRLRNPALAALLREIAERGSAAFYQGENAEALVQQVNRHPSNPGRLSLSDLDGYQPRQRDAICTLWQQRYRVCGFPPPSSGHMAQMQILGLLEQLGPLAPLEQGLPSADFLHRYTEAARLAYADRAQYLADPDFTPAPGGDWNTLLAPGYLKQRASLIGPTSMGTAEPGNPGPLPLAFAPQPEQPEYGTSHISIVDADGNALAMTTSIEQAFGSRLLNDGGTGLPGGYLLNNELTDFAFEPRDAQGKPVANRVEPGKRPRSSMSPTLVFEADGGRLLASVGSPGGAAIIHFTAKTLLGMYGWGLDAQRAIDLPNFASYNGPTMLEAGRFPRSSLKALEARGHEVRESEMTSGLQAIQRTASGWFGGADPRREGLVMGE
ncbi:gamma-glutamyltransferase family protein [Stutzerimonas nitrititolerans]|uniref:Gamma-glutamyltransferase family protein n=1 Tax=Stutzerimonas nitrititolerans TaxID=2482751 RepID=A0AA41WM99_9GAMM|nr:gamma-glutamyltransferase family protein [Stutzerimonas nitrititolerans]MCO7546078.1 gamma-glutamyltransferase family protein [Stutzerimonas nitrititolerans]